MRKLGFEETPDYDFLRELFSKVIRNMGDVEDGVYDWMLLNNGKGWETLSKRQAARQGLTGPAKKAIADNQRHATTRTNEPKESQMQHQQHAAQQRPAEASAQPMPQHLHAPAQPSKKRSLLSKLTCGLCD